MAGRNPDPDWIASEQRSDEPRRRRTQRRSAGNRAGSGVARLLAAWRKLPHEQRLAAFAALGLFLTLFLPWYQTTIIASGQATRLQSATASVTGWGAFSFVEAAVLVVAVGVLVLLFTRAEGRAFHLPGGDGGVILAAGAWTCALVIWRMFDKQGTSGHGQYATTYGIEWGIFVALAVAAFLAYAGSRIRSARQAEPPLPGDQGRPGALWLADAAPYEDPPRRRRARPTPVAGRSPTPGRSPVSGPESDPPTSGRSPVPGPESDPPTEPAPRPRRARPATAGELARTEIFERVVPEDPPTLKIGRPSTPAGRRRSPAADPDDSPTIPLDRGDDAP